MNSDARKFLSDALCDKIESYEKQNMGLSFNRCTLYAHIVPKCFTGTWDKYYIGVTERSFSRRCGSNGNCYKGRHFKNAINKYGWDNIKHLVISDNLTKNQMFELEVEVIAYLKSNNSKYGYNISKGGPFGGNQKGTIRIYCYKECGEYVNSFESAAEAGRFFNCDRSIISHAVDTTIMANGFQWRSYKVDNCGLHKRCNQKVVYQYDLSWKFVQKFETISIASDVLGIPSASIYSAVSGHRIAYGYYFLYELI